MINNSKTHMTRWLPLLWMLLFSTSAFSQVTSSNQTPTARTTALSASNIAMGGSAELLLTNPALLAEFEGFGAFTGYQNLFAQNYIQYSVAGLSLESGESAGNFGLSMSSLKTSNGRSSLADETVIGFHHGIYIMKDRLSSLALGTTINYLQLSYGKSAGPSGDGSDGMSLGTTSKIGVDVGLLATLGKKHRAAVIVKNINGPTIGTGGKIAALPQVLVGGFAYTPVEEVVTTFSLNFSSGHPVEFHAGLEYKLSPHYSILTGMQSQPNRLSAGMKIDAKGINIEYGVITHPVLPLTHVITLSLHLKGQNK